MAFDRVTTMSSESTAADRIKMHETRSMATGPAPPIVISIPRTFLVGILMANMSLLAIVILGIWHLGAASADSEKQGMESPQKPERKQVLVLQPRSKKQASPPDQDAGQKFWEAIVRAGQREREQAEAARRWSQQTFGCRACGGAGRYSYVDSSGTLQSRTCPYCQGRSP